ncbi:Elongation factor Tu, mitochondrial [Strongyloides ratti]|uniref:protein-synthesizing GTPase n=1 Tax=Strongyloides ratti TaxID=34506 RepID=A0A090LFE0_STRRB|nr:Elongation factor Tu, mitochondrial [Strongyloides ratti]CEF68511.1 Elongation factor Tu, mitochondrial [Strongyloides ratti]
MLSTFITKSLNPFQINNGIISNIVFKNTIYTSLISLAVTQKNKSDIFKKSNLNVGTIGHIDHGKTTLTSAITRVLSEKGGAKFLKFEEIDKSKEEKKRGITINAANVGYESQKRRYAHTDCPGHKDFIKNMICGTSQMDVAILVIAATDGIMPQTKEHLILAKQIGLKNIIVFINKADLVDDDILELCELEARELLSHNGFDGDNAKVIRGSALSALSGTDKTSVEDLINALDDIPDPEREQDSNFLLPIMQKVKIQGRGTVVIGTLEKGTIKKGDPIQLIGLDRDVKAVASDIHVFNKSVPSVSAGEHCAILCRGVKADDVRRGMWLGTPGSIKTTNLLKAELYLLDESEGGRKVGIRTNYSDTVFCSTWDQVGRFHISKDMVMPGEHTTAHILFLKHVPVEKNISFTLREGMRNLTIARGIITDILKPVDIDSFHKIDMNEIVKNATSL